MKIKIALPLLIAAAATQGQDWTQFRGPNSSGVSEESNLPVEFGPETNVVWKTAIPPGHSSPVIARDTIFLTAVENDKLLTLALSRASGKILWRREAPRPRKQTIERPANSPTSASPVTDGRNVWVFFQDFGLLAYGPDGNELWRMPLGPFNNPFGHGASPILSGDTLLMICDQDVGSFMLALDKNSGRVLWRTPRPHAQRGYATPVLYKSPEGPLQVIVAGSYRLSGYDLTGELWYIRRLPWQIKPTPVIGKDTVYFITSSGESEPGEQEIVPPFAEALAKLDVNKDGKLSKEEIPDARTRGRFDEYLDLDDTGYLEERDWLQLRDRRLGENALRAYRLGGRGDLTESNSVWKHTRSLPNVPSPLLYRNVLYTLKEGGILSSFDSSTGAILKQAGGQWEVLRVNDLNDGCKATPAVADGKLYVRTYSFLYCFAKKPD